MQTLLPTRRPASKLPRRAKRSSRGSRSSRALTARPCAASQKSAAALLASHYKNPQPRFNRNQQYSITAVSDGGGSVVERYAYSAYGQVTVADASGTVQAGSASNNRYTYTGREWDEDLALYHYRARMYDAVAGRFCSRDPIGFEGSQWNVYEYVGNRPLDFVDSTGMQGHMITRRCGTTVYRDRVRNPRRRCCNGQLYTVNKESCRDGQVITLQNPCDDYPDPSGPGGNCCDDGTIRKDLYPEKAKSICNNFLELYHYSSTVKCVASCLAEAEQRTRPIPYCQWRNSLRFRAHVDCYTKCMFVPHNGLPEGAAEVGWGMLLPDVWGAYWNESYGKCCGESPSSSGGSPFLF